MAVKGAIAYGMVNPKATNFATMYADDFGRMVADGIPLNWRMNARAVDDRKHSYVRVRVPGKDNRQVAQLVLQAPRGTGITYMDGNPLNLRRENLIIGHGRSKCDHWVEIDEDDDNGDGHATASPVGATAAQPQGEPSATIATSAT